MYPTVDRLILAYHTHPPSNQPNDLNQVDMGNHEKAYQFSHYTERFRNMPVSDWAEPIRSDNGPAPNNWWVGGAVRGLFCYACWSFHTRMLFQAVNQNFINNIPIHPYFRWYSFNLGPIHFVAISTEVYDFARTFLSFRVVACRACHRAMRVWSVCFVAYLPLSPSSILYNHTHTNSLVHRAAVQVAGSGPSGGQRQPDRGPLVSKKVNWVTFTRSV